MTGDGEPQTMHEALFHAHVVKQLLDLRETLVRHDENLKALELLEAAPYFAYDHPAIVAARRDQYLMVRHVLPPDRLLADDRDRDFYAEAYAANPHEQPFEDQYGLSVEEADRIPRVRFLLDGLNGQTARKRPQQVPLRREFAGHYANTLETVIVKPRVLDVSANDGWMAARLSLGGFRCDCLDLHPGNVALARERKLAFPLIGRVEQAALEDAPLVIDHPDGHDAIACFETIEHVMDPRVALQALVDCLAPHGRLYVSTPHGAVEQGNTPWPPVVEPKGHVRVFTEPSFRALLEEFGEVEELVRGEDGVLVARVRPG